MGYFKRALKDVRAGLTGDDIRACFELMLGRSADDASVQYHLDLGFADRAALGRYIQTTEEFQAYFHGVPYKLSDFDDPWRRRFLQASVRRSKLQSFGPNARGVLVEAETGWYVVDPEDSSVSLSLLRDGDYAPDELATATAALPLGGRVLVVGTHIGGLAIPLSKRSRKLDAVEANPRTQRLLAANLRLNACTNVELFPIAASSRTEMLEFLLSRDNSGGAKRKPVAGGEIYYYDEPEVVAVEARALDDVLGDEPYDLIIMDCEGSEYYALQGMRRILSQCKALSIEFLVHHIVNVAGAGVDAFTDQIEPYFEWMFVPARKELIGKSDIRAALRDMFARGEGHDGLYFLKEVPAAWSPS